MSNTSTENQQSKNQNELSAENSKQELKSNDDYSQRQLQSAFQPSTVISRSISLFLCFLSLSLI